jgi:citrate lyase subunit beta/citryl-CoA lyase
MTVPIRPRRSVLYMPGSNARAIEKARTLPVDGVILDLEDAVAPEAKEAARRQVAEAVKAGGFGAREVFVRVNGIDTPWHADDMYAAAQAAPDAILVPKVSSVEQLDRIGQRLLDMKVDLKTRVWAMIETPEAIFNINALAARAHDSETRLAGFVMGTNDLAKETRARIVPGRQPMLSWLARCLLAAHAHRIDILDGVYNDIGNAEGFAAECAQARDMGFDGKTLIHPNQIDPCNAAFSPAPDEVEQARKTIAAFDLPENRDKGVVQIDGRMVERMHAEMARHTVAIADAIAARRV